MDPNQQLAQVKAKLAQFAQVQELLTNPNALAALMQPQAPQSTAVVQEPVVKAEHAQIIQFFESFVLKEPEVSKQLVSSMGSFYRHMQSMVAKSAVDKPADSA